MRRAPACLFSAIFAISLGVSGTKTIAAPGVRHSEPIPRGVHGGRPGSLAIGHRIGSRHHPTRPRGGFRHGLRWPHKYGHALFRHHLSMPLWPYVETAGTPAPVIVEQSPQAPPPVLPGIPSISDLPASTGIRSAPTGSPTFYVLDGERRSLRRGGAKVVTMGQAGAGAETETDVQGNGPRIIHLKVPVGR